MFDPNGDDDCFYKSVMSSSTIKSATNIIASSRFSTIQNRVTDRYLYLSLTSLFKGYTSKYAGAFNLLDTFRYPKMCAYKSLNMTTGVRYYRG